MLTARRRIERALPFALALGLVAAVVARIDRRGFAAALARVAFAPFIASAALFVFALLVADSLATAAVCRRAGVPVGNLELLRLRGASYIPSLLNHHVGQAFLTLQVARAHRTPLARVAGATLVVYASWIACLLALACAVIPLSPLPTVTLVAPLAIALAYGAVLVRRPPWLASRTFLTPLFDAGLRGHAYAIVVRLPHLAIQLLGAWIPFAYFGVYLPTTEAVTLLPLLMVVTTLPLTPQGVGTRDVVAAALFVHYAPLETIVAATTTWALTLTIVETAIGLLLMAAKRSEPKNLPEDGAMRRERKP